MKKIKENKTHIFYNENLIEKNFYCDIVKPKKYKILKTLKDDNRSLVMLIDINRKKYVLKIPKEKNRRKWQRFISIFRGGESMREFLQLEKLKNNNFNAPTPLIAIEKKRCKMTYDSLIISEYIENHEATIDDLDIVIKCLNDIHKKGFLHGDSQLTNFLIKNNEIYLIDSKLLNNKFGKFGIMYEYIYLQESCPINLDKYIKQNDFYFKTAKLLNTYLHFWGKIRKILKNKG